MRNLTDYSIHYNKRIANLDTNDLKAVYDLRIDLLSAYRAFHISLASLHCFDAKIDNLLKVQ